MTTTIAQSLGPKIGPPTGIAPIGSGFPQLISNIITLATIIAGLMVLFNFILAGYSFLTAGGDPKKVQQSLNKIWQSLVGLIIIIAAVAISSIIGKIFFDNASFFLKPTITGPGSP